MVLSVNCEIFCRFVCLFILFACVRACVCSGEFFLSMLKLPTAFILAFPRLLWISFYYFLRVSASYRVPLYPTHCHHVFTVCMCVWVIFTLTLAILMWHMMEMNMGMCSDLWWFIFVTFIYSWNRNVAGWHNNKCSTITTNITTCASILLCVLRKSMVVLMSYMSQYGFWERVEFFFFLSWIPRCSVVTCHCLGCDTEMGGGHTHA